MEDGKKEHGIIDPDYYYDLKEEPPSKKQKINCVNEKLTAVNKIEAIISQEFDQEIQSKQIELDEIIHKINKVESLLDKLRGSIVSAFYADQQPSSFQANAGDDKNVIHPAVKELFIGKSPKKSAASVAQSDRSTNQGKSCSSSASIKTETAVQDSSQHELSRLKQKVHIIIGNVSRYIPPENREQNDLSTHKWMVYVRTAKHEQPVEKLLSKVLFFLHPSYKPNDLVEVNCHPFHLTRRGWGEFPVRVQLHFHESRNKAIDVIHNLKLDKSFTGLQTLGAETVVDLLLYKKNNASSIHESALLLKQEGSSDQEEEEENIADDSNNYTICEDKKKEEKPENNLVKPIIVKTENVKKLEPAANFRKFYKCHGEHGEIILVPVESFKSGAASLLPKPRVQPKSELPQSIIRVIRPIDNQVSVLKVENASRNHLNNKPQTAAVFNHIKLMNSSESSVNLRAIPNLKSNVKLSPINDDWRPIISKFETMSELVHFMLKKHPLISEAQERTVHHYCCKSLELYRSWPVEKQRANEWQRSRAVVKSCKFVINKDWMQVLKPDDVWTTKQVLIYARRTAFTPLFSEYEPGERQQLDIEELNLLVKSSLSDPNIPLLNIDPPKQSKLPSSANTDEDIDVEDMSDDICNPKPNTVESHETNNDDQQIFLPAVHNSTFIHQVAADIGVKLSPVSVFPDVSAVVLEDMILKATQNFAEDLLRGAHASAYNQSKDIGKSGEIAIADVILSISNSPLFDFLSLKNFGADTLANSTTHKLS